MMLVAALVVAAAVASSSGAAAPADGTYKYSILQSGSSIGTSSVTVKRSDIGITLHETETLGEMSFAVDETLDTANLAPKSYVATYTMGKGSQTARMVFSQSGATMTFDGANSTQSLSLPSGTKNGYVLEGALMSGFMLLPAQIHAVRATDFAQFIPSKVVVGSGHVDRTVNLIRPPDVPGGDVSLSLRLSIPAGVTVNMDEWYDPSTFALHQVSVPSQDVIIKLTK